MTSPRVALIGVWLESNRAATVATQEYFEELHLLRGEEILSGTRAKNPSVMGEAAAFVKTMDATGPWQPVPILLAGCHPFGPLENTLFDTFLDEIKAGLEQAGRLDAVYIANHGAMVTELENDPDGVLIEEVRKIVGPTTRIVVTLDLHANISDKMVDNSDIIVGYRTNPHVDMIERGEEAALILRLMLAGQAEPKAVHIKLPLVPPPTTLLSSSGPYGELIDFGNRRRAELGGEILNVSIFGGFAFSDSSKNGFSVVVTARRDRRPAQRLATEIAERAWAVRTRFRRSLLSIEKAVAVALDEQRTPVIFADSGDNPGGGGTGRTTQLLSKLVSAGANGVLFGSFYDVPLAVEAHRTGLGNRFRAKFNSRPGMGCDDFFEADAEVVGLHEGDVIGRLGYARDRTLHLGLSAAIRIGGVTVVVISTRVQTADPIFFEMFGFDIGSAHTVVVKSRGHFRAGFVPWFTDDRIFEVDTDGLTAPNLERREWKFMPRPIYPLDKQTVWG